MPDRTPNEWERKIQRTSRQGGLSKTGQFRQEFWAHVEQRNPGTVWSGLAASNVRHRIEESGRQVSQYVSTGGVGIYYPRERGESESERNETLAPAVAVLREELKAEGLAERLGDWCGLFISIDDATDRCNWDRMSDWLHRRNEQWTRALQEIAVRSN